MKQVEPKDAYECVGSLGPHRVECYHESGWSNYLGRLVSSPYWRWRIRAKNGNIRADSGEGYARRIDALAFPEGLGFTKFCVVEE